MFGTPQNDKMEFFRMKKKISFIFGTRPEAIKLCPVILARLTRTFTEQKPDTVLVQGDTTDAIVSNVSTLMTDRAS